MKVYFIGAGPGDPKLLTLKAVECLAAADVVIYAGSLVNPRVLEYARPGAVILDSAGMTLEQLIQTMAESVKQGKTVARLHAGDPSIYGALNEQAERLDAMGIKWEVVPGVSSLSAAAATLGREYTVPGGPQTLIITRMGGRTTVREGERLASLSVHNASMCIFLSAHMAGDVARELAEGYPPHTPAALVEKASWPEERVLTGSLSEIGGMAEKAGMTRTALILVGDFLKLRGRRSRLYDGTFDHGYRRGSP